MTGIAAGCRRAGLRHRGRRAGRASRAARARRARRGRLRGRASWNVTPSWTARPAPRPGDVLIGLPSPGLRSNGYSLARRALLERAGRSLDGPAWDGAGRGRWPTSCCARRSSTRPAVLALLRRRRGPRRRPHHRRRAARQRAPGPRRRPRRRVRAGPLAGAPDLRRDPARRAGWTTPRWPGCSTWASAWSWPCHAARSTEALAALAAVRPGGAGRRAPGARAGARYTSPD